MNARVDTRPLKYFIQGVISGRLHAYQEVVAELKRIKIDSIIVNDLFDLINQVESFESIDQLKQSPDFLIELYAIELVESNPNLDYLGERRRLINEIKNSALNELYFDSYDKFKTEFKLYSR